jgi:hypothetical protein
MGEIHIHNRYIPIRRPHLPVEDPETQNPPSRILRAGVSQGRHVVVAQSGTVSHVDTGLALAVRRIIAAGSLPYGLQSELRAERGQGNETRMRRHALGTLPQQPVSRSSKEKICKGPF